MYLIKTRTVMKTTSSKIKIVMLAAFFIMALVPIMSQAMVVVCEITKTNGGGFTTTIESVTCNLNGSHTIVLRVEHNGCSGSNCQELSHYSVQATPDTYSNVSVEVISGNMTYGNIALGPNLGSDPFQGFKVDNISNIGDGNAGVFTITYTLTGTLQQQMVSAKAGNDGQFATFTVEDFEYVMNCAGTTCDGGNNDSDDDGCNDDEDDYPTDPDRCTDNYFPANGYGTLAYEDLWPGKGDYDFNDLVLDYEFKIVTNGQNYVVEMFGTFIIKAFGASYENGFGFQLESPIDPEDLTVSGYSLTENYITLLSNGTESGQTKPVIIVYDNAYNQMQWPGIGIGVNTEQDMPYITPDTLRLTVGFPAETYTYQDLNISGFNPFIIVNQDRGVEVHLPDYLPTDLVNQTLFGTMEDYSNPAQGVYYKTDNNLPWAIHIYETFSYPIEKQLVTLAHLKFAEWAVSGGVLFPDWYKNLTGYRNNSMIFQVPTGN